MVWCIIAKKGKVEVALPDDDHIVITVCNLIRRYI